MISVEALTPQSPQFSSKGLRSFEIAFDQKDSREKNFKTSDEREQFASYLETQMETHLGERYNVELSSFSYDIKDGFLWGKDMEEPFIKSLMRGRDFRRVNGKEVDFAREEAEVIGFEKIQSELLDPDTKTGTVMLSLSPRGGKGSTYQHNFYDIFTLRMDENDRRYVEVRRYASALGINDYKEKLGVFIPENIDDHAAYLLENPLRIPFGLTPDDIHKHLHRDYEFLDEHSFNLIKKHCKSLISAYAEAIIEQPDNDVLHKTLFNTVLNKADEIEAKLKAKGEVEIEKEYGDRRSIRADVENYAFREVKKINTGCGSSEGYALPSVPASPFSLAEFGKRAEDDPNLCRCGGDKAHFHCPGKKEGKDCRHKIIVGKGIISCPSCGEGKKC